MTPRLRPTTWPRAAAVAAGLAGGLAGCRHDAVVVPAFDTYYPLVVGSYRSYAVQDSTWAAGVVTVRQSQLRERVSEQFSDAAGLPAYRLVRSRRADASAAWADDSVLVAQPLTQALALTQNNVRTVELLYPVRADKGWNASAYGPDTTAYTRLPGSYTRYYASSVGGAATIPAAGTAPAKSYEATAGVHDKAPAATNDGLLRRNGLAWVYARGVGPVLRRRYYYELFTTAANGAQTPTGKIQNGHAHRETLLETGTL